MTHYALVIGNGTYDDPKISSLNSPLADISGLVEVLTNPKIGDFQPEHIVQLRNATHDEMRRAIHEFFDDKTGSDTVLCYFSGHGQKNQDGDLFLLARDSKIKLLDATALEATFLSKHLRRCAAQRKILILDCCYSGAYLRGSKALLDQPVGTKQIFEDIGYGSFVLTSSDATKLSWDGETFSGKVTPSVFTGVLIKGLQTGDADKDGDGYIGLEELFKYIRSELPPGTNIKPIFDSYKEGEDLIFARNIRGERHARLPDELQEQLISPNTDVREAAVRRLGQLLQSPRPKLVEQARERLRQLIDEDDSRRIEKLAQRLLDAASANNLANTLPERVSLLELLQCTDLAELEQLAAQQWARSREAQHADWLQVPLGKTAPDTQRILRLSAKLDGVHGLIGGGTNSGKSELLMTLIAGLALHYAPEIVNFVLIDYKGGGAFKPFEKQLPHVVDVITNLNKSAVQRVFTAIHAELNRRAGLLANNREMDIVTYRKKGLHLGPTGQPFPHLVIIIDEYAEMITDNPEVAAELERITRTGRSLGVNLLLASQRPLGITEEMSANTKLRICLRVEQVETSHAVLRRPDAALLPYNRPGRGYLQVGDEEIELVQVAYGSEPFANGPPDPDGRPQSFYSIIVQLAQKLLGTAPRPLAPWPPPLPSTLTFATPLVQERLDPTSLPLLTLGANVLPATLNPLMNAWLNGTGSWPGVDWQATALQAVVGLLDNPYTPHQRPFVVDFARGHGVMFGRSGWGKTTFLRALALGLAATHSPAELHIHVLDPGRRDLALLRELPHLGTFLSLEERDYAERVEHFWRELNELIEQRKRLFSEAGVSRLAEYNARGESPILPAQLILIDDMAHFIDAEASYKKGESDTILENLIEVLRQGLTYGVHFVVTANRPAVIADKLYNLFSERFTLGLADTAEYSVVFGNGNYQGEEIPGRGLRRIEQGVVAFQVALPPVPGDWTGRRAGTVLEQTISELGAQMRQAIALAPYQYPPPLMVHSLPNSITLADLIAREHGFALDSTFLPQLRILIAKRWADSRLPEQADWLVATLGLAMGNRQRNIIFSAFRDGSHGIIAGGTGTGKSELLMTLVSSLALNYAPDILNLVLIDYKGGGAFHPLAALPHVVDLVTNLNSKSVTDIFTAIGVELNRREALHRATNTRNIIDYRRLGLHLSHAPYPHLFILIDEYAEMISAHPECVAKLETITRKGRSLGVSLILSAQRPDGVSPQMWANIRLRFCLRVEDAEVSNQLIRNAKAAYLPGLPGRGYLGAEGSFPELIQVAYTRERIPNGPLDTDGWPMHLYQLVPLLAQEVLGNAPRPQAPWPPALPDQFSLDTQLVLGKAGTVMLCYAVSLWRANTSAEVWPGFDWQSDQFVVSVGVVESAIREEQVPFNLFEHTDHIGVFGDTLSGKTSLLQTIFTSLTTSYRPNEVNFFLLDLNGNSFANFEQFPHVLALLSVDHPDFDSQVVHWFEGLGEQVERRQQLLTASGHADIYSYNRQHSEYSLPIIVVMIDDLAVLQQGHQSLLEKTLVVLTLRMLPLGMHLVITEQHPDVLPKRLFNLLKQRISFFQREQRLYRTIFAQDLPELPKVPGYAYSKHHSNLLLLRTALPLSDVSVVASSATFKEIGDRMTIYWDEHFGLAPEKRLTLEGILNRIETMQAIIIAAMREQFATSGTSPLAEHFAQLTPLQWYDPTALMGLITMLAANDKLSTLSETALLQYYRNRYTI